MRENGNKTRLNFINTNARSLCPKIGSLNNCFEELDLSFSVVTETWLSDGVLLDRDKDDLEHGAGLGLLHRNRPPNSRGVSHGGVAIIYRKAKMSLKELDIKNLDAYEVVAAIGNVIGQSRKVLVVACYMPPNYSVTRGKDCLSYITDLVLHLKRMYKDPIFYIAGDFNQWDLTSALVDYQDLVEAPVGPTRGNRSIDRTFTNISEHIVTATVLPPLESDDSMRTSDHLVALVEADLPRKEAYELLRYTYRLYTDDGADLFLKWIVNHHWGRYWRWWEAMRKQRLISAISTERWMPFFPM